MLSDPTHYYCSSTNSQSSHWYLTTFTAGLVRLPRSQQLPLCAAGYFLIGVTSYCVNVIYDGNWLLQCNCSIGLILIMFTFITDGLAPFTFSIFFYFFTMTRLPWLVSHLTYPSNQFKCFSIPCIGQQGDSLCLIPKASPKARNLNKLVSFEEWPCWNFSAIGCCSDSIQNVWSVQKKKKKRMQKSKVDF